MLAFIFIQGQLESRGVEGRKNKICSFPFNLKPVAPPNKNNNHTPPKRPDFLRLMFSSPLS